MSSTRLPGKVLMPILGEPMLYRQIERIRKAKRIDNLIVATSTSKEDDQIEKLCNNINVRCYRGSLDDVLDRFYQAAAPFSPDYIIRLTGDCPLFDPGLADDLVDFFLSGDYDYTSNTVVPTYPDGLDIEIMKFSTLKSAWENATLLSEREHVTPYILKHPEIFSIGCMKNLEDLSGMRWTVDEPEDYEFINYIYNSLCHSEKQFNWIDVLTLVRKNPEFSSINSGFRRNEGYEKSLILQAKNEIIKLNRVYLRILRKDDVTNKYCDWLNDDSTNRFLVTKKADLAELKEYVNDKFCDKNVLFYGLFSNETNEHIGNVKLEPIDFSKKETTLGILIGEANWRGVGICKEVCRGISKYVFNSLGLDRIYLGVIDENKFAKKCYESCGFKSIPPDNDSLPSEKNCVQMKLEKGDLI